MLGLTSLAYLSLAARALDSAGFAVLSVVWTILFILGPGLFLPLEQEMAKRLAVITDARLARIVIRRALLIAAVLAGFVAVLTAAIALVVGSHLLNSDTALLLAMIAANSVLALVHCSRGWLAGTGRFVRYGVQLGLDGTLRMVGAGALLISGTKSAAAFGWMLFAAQLVAVFATTWGVKFPRAAAAPDQPVDPLASRAVSLTVLARSIAFMAAATLASQLLVNAGPVAVKLLAPPSNALAGRFLTTLIIARIPLFMFAALQASLLPGLAKMMDAGQWDLMTAALRRLVVSLAVTGLGLTVLVWIAGPTMVGVLFGEAYRADRTPMVVLTLGCTVYVLASVLAQALLAMHLSGTVAVGWWIGLGAFALSLVNSVSLPMRVSVALLIGSIVAGLWFLGALRMQRDERYPKNTENRAVLGIPVQ